MGSLGNLDHERFCQSAHSRIWAGEKRAGALAEAYLETMYRGDKSDAEAARKAVKPNARRLANSKLCKARLAELSDYAGQLAGIDSGWCVRQLARRVADFNVDDYLTPVGQGERFFDIANVSRERLGRLAELTIDEDIIDAGEDCLRKVRKTRIKAYDPAALIALIARIRGYLAPDKLEHAGPNGGPLVVTWLPAQS